ncbi:MAG: 5'-nucleotidase C-terminal domain-containing protein [Oscillospiraceae bacterium]|nr:5'-nucleotidase C-terminal domain-containing protein [Oscillospiraceae bacterium]
MKKRLLSLILCLCIAVSLIPCMGFAPKSETIVILYENDVHCAVEGYSKLAAMKKELSKQYNHVGVVSSGDYLQGGSLGVVSRGEYIVKLMNLVGYDAVTLGNHEFDYKLPRLLELVELMNTKPVCANFKDDSGNNVFEPYKIVSYGDIDVAYIGVTTPHTLTSSSPAQFKNKEGEYVYNFCANDLYEVVQGAIDAVKEKGADVIIAITHLGYMEEGLLWPVNDLIENTEGLDVVLDAHSHSVIEGVEFEDKKGEKVILTSTGTKFASVGKLTISGDELKTELIPMSEYENTDAAVDEYIAKINEEYATLGNRKIGSTDFRLDMDNGDGVRLIRNSQTNLGNFCADAYREMTGADIGYANGGGIRANIEAGDITFNDLLSVFPYNNVVCVAKLNGQTILDFLELAMINYPEEDGQFAHISGLTYDVDPSVKSTVRLDENGAFVSVDGARRVSDVKVLNRETGVYEPIDEGKIYAFATHNYFLEDFGGGMEMFRNAKSVENLGILDVELLESFLTEKLAGKVSEKYKVAEERINFTDEYIPLRKTFEAKGYEVIWRAEEPKKIVVNTDHCTYIFMADTNIVTVDGEKYESDRIAYIEKGKTYISADCVALCEMLCSVK